MTLQAVIFDLDGVITDTAELHYQAWQQLADEVGLTFNREINEQLRGVSRRDSLRIILNGRDETEERIQEMMARKDGYYVAMLDTITPGHLLPGVSNLLDELDTAQIPYAIASASKNASTVCERLGITSRLAALVDGHSTARQKPHPDLFCFAAAALNYPPGQCLVVEDAAAGVEAALAAGMAALALGPAARFGQNQPHGRVTRYSSLERVTLNDLRQAAALDKTWTVVQDEFHPQEQHHLETVFTIGNGYFASRGSFEEGFPLDMATTFAHGVFDDMPVGFTALANMPNWLDMRITLDGHHFRLDQGRLLYFRRTLDMRQAVLRRYVRWQSPHGKVVDLYFERFISYPREHLGAIRVLVTAVSHTCTISIEAGINGHVSNKNLLHWHLLHQGQTENGMIWLHSQTRHTKIELGTAVTIHTHADQPASYQQCPGQPQLTVSQSLRPGQTLQVDKLAAYTLSRDEGDHALDVNARAMAELQETTFDTLRKDHIMAWDHLWQDCDVVIQGDEEAQLAVRFNLFQLLAAAPQHDARVSIGAKTLSGYGYFGHVFWDTEIFILPFFMYTQPQLARNMLKYRYHTLPGARRKAAAGGYSGAQYAWESALTGDEVTPTWVPDSHDRSKLVRIWTGDIQIHISADIAYALTHYWRVTGDDAFMRDYGAEVILDAARFWGSRAELEQANGRRRYALRNVIGPDEYHDHVDNNSFTNYIARWHLRTALQLLDWLQTTFPEKYKHLITKLQITTAVRRQWQDVIDHIIFLFDQKTGLIDQFENFFELEVVPPEFVAAADKSLQLIFGIEGANERQVLKQADVIMLLCLFRDQFNQKTWHKNWDTYMPKTDHRYGSSLGPSFHAWAACEMDQPEEAYKHFMLAARADLRNPRGNANDGIHAASAGGVWQAIAFGFAGLRLNEAGFSTQPRLPAHWQRLQFKIKRNGVQHIVDIHNQT